MKSQKKHLRVDLLPAYFFFVIGLACAFPLAGWAQTLPLLNFNFAAGATNKVGFAAIGITTNDFWNPDSNGGGPLSLTNLEWSDGTPCPAVFSQYTSFSGWVLSTGDPMYDTYFFNQAGSPIFTLADLPTGAYDFYIYGHGDASYQTGSYDVKTGGTDYGVQTTSNSTLAYTSDVWQQGLQYVVYTNVGVYSNSPVQLTMYLVGAYAIINGMQIRPHTVNPPLICFQPESQTVASNGPAELSVVAVGATPLQYQWSFNGSNLTGATASRLILTNVQSSNAGAYAVVVKNQYAAVQSSNALLTLSPLPLLNMDFGAAPTTKSGFAAIGLSSTDFWNDDNNLGYPSPTTLKYADGTFCPASITISGNNGTWGLSTGDPMYDNYMYGTQMEVTVLDLPSGAYDFFIYGHGNGDNQNGIYDLACGNVDYGTNQTAANTLAWTSDAWQENLQYVVYWDVQVTNNTPVLITIYGTNAGNAAVINGMQICRHTDLPLIGAQPAGVISYPGESTQLSVSAVSSEPLSYQWFFNGAMISGATNSILSLSDLQFSNQGFYSVAVENAAGQITSSNAFLEVAPVPSAPLMNINFAAASTNKTGFAAAGLTTNDYWNGFYPISCASVSESNLLWSDSSPSGVALTVVACGAAYSLSTGDGMYDSYIGVNGSGFSVVLTNLPSGIYDFYIYGHGTGNENGVYDLTSGNIDYGTNSTSSSTLASTSDLWQLGLQYVVFSQVVVSNSQPVTINVFNSGANYSVLNGLQIVGHAPPIIVQQPQAQILNTGSPGLFSVQVVNANLVSYQWLFNNVPIAGATNSTLAFFSAQATNGGVYSVIASNGYGSVTSSPVQLSLTTNAPSPLINIDFGASPSTEVGFAAIGSQTNDFWNGGGTGTNLWRADETYSGVTVSITALTQTSSLTTGDPMYDSYIFRASSGSVILSNLPTGIYDFYIYGHGDLDNENGIYHLLSGNTDYGTNATATNSASWHSDVWQENLQYVVFRRVNVLANQPVRIDVLSQPSFGVINGLQIATPFAASVAVQPQNIVADTGSSAQFNVGLCSGTSPFSYQWLFNGTNIAGATNSFLTLGYVVATNAGNYAFMVSNDCGFSFSSNATLVVNTYPPAITNQPQSLTVNADSNATFSVGASGSPVLLYQWYLNGVSLSGATASVLNLYNVQTNNSGAYSVLVSNTAGAAVSSNAFLTVLFSTPSFTLQPSNQTVRAGTNVSFSVSATGTAPLSYQWFFQGQALASATNTALSLTNVQSGNAGSYTVIVTNLYGLAASSNVVLNVNPSPPIILSQPANITTFRWATASFNALVSGSMPLTYQWLWKGTNILGATNSSLTLSDVQITNIGFYQLIASNAYGVVASSNVELIVSSVFAWGLNNAGQTNVPVGLDGIVTLSAGLDYDLALDTNGLVLAWGANNYGHTNVPAGLSDVVAISAGNYQCLALKADGTCVAWGYNGYGAGTVPAGLSNVVAIATGQYHDLALKSDGTVFAWGSNPYGQTNLPTGLSNVVAIAAGYYHNVALRANGTVVAWGYDVYGETNVPAELNNVVAIGATALCSIAVKADGSVVVWGYGNYLTNVPPGVSNVVAVAGGEYHILALKSDGTVTAWGMNTYGATNVPPLTNVISVAAGEYHSIVLISDSPSPRQIALEAPPFGNGQFSIAIPSLSGKIYELQYKNNLNDSNWIAFPLVPGNGSVLRLADPSVTNQQRFYRVQKW